MGVYSRWIFPWLCDAALNHPAVAGHRQQLLAAADGEILEIGFGTGLNLPCYPEHVCSIAAVEPNRPMHRRAQKRIRQSGIDVDLHQAGSESLPFPPERFDTVVSTFTLCSIEPIDAAVAEIYRVLKPAGKLLFLEHGLSPEPSVQKWQRRLNGLQRRMAGNCHLDRDIRGLIAMQPFRSIQAVEFYLEKTPKTHGYAYRGHATR